MNRAWVSMNEVQVALASVSVQMGLQLGGSKTKEINIKHVIEPSQLRDHSVIDQG